VTTRDAAPTTGSRKRRLALSCGCLLIGGCVVLGLGLVLAKDRIATHVVRGMLADRGVDCTPAVDVSWSPTDGTMSVAPTRCTVPAGAVSAVELPQGGVLRVEGLEPVDVSAPELIVDLRRQRSLPADLGTLDALAALAGAADGLTRLLVDAAELSNRDLPDARFERVTLRAGGTAVTTLDGVDVTSVPTHLTLEARTVRIAAGPTTLDAVVLDTTPTRGSIRGSVEASLDVVVATLRQRFELTLTGDGLDGPAPVFDVDLQE
jgi:hypothetical protein